MLLRRESLLSLSCHLSQHSLSVFPTHLLDLFSSNGHVIWHFEVDNRLEVSSSSLMWHRPYLKIGWWTYGPGRLNIKHTGTYTTNKLRANTKDRWEGQCGSERELFLWFYCRFLFLLLLLFLPRIFIIGLMMDCFFFLQYPLLLFSLLINIIDLSGGCMENKLFDRSSADRLRALRKG